MKPLCFVLMPYGRKADETGRVIDFDAIYARIIAPAAGRTGLDVIRSDEELVGGTIHKQMFERLLLCEYAIADLTTANPNVHYELGARHAMRPRSTVIIFADGMRLPFDVANQRGIPYRIDGSGAPTDPDGCAARIAARLSALRDETAPDSPVYEFIQDMPRPEVPHEKTDLFRQRVDISRRLKARLEAATRQGADAVRALAAEPDFAEIGDLEAGVVVSLYLAYRDVGAYDDMVALHARMAAPLQRVRLVQEQLGFALNRLGRTEDAEAVLQAIIAAHGPSSETNGLLGRIYKDRWRTALASGDGSLALGEHKRAVAAYLAGFEADWRDAYPGINAATLMELGEKPDPRFAEIALVARYAAARKAAGPRADYWDFATLIEAAVLLDDQDAAEAALADALSRIKIGWHANTTVDNLSFILEARERRGKEVGWVRNIKDALKKASLRRT